LAGGQMGIIFDAILIEVRPENDVKRKSCPLPAIVAGVASSRYISGVREGALADGSTV